MKNKKLHTIKSPGFKTPENYFESLEGNILNRLEQKSSLGTVNSTGFKVSDTYFESFDEKVLKSLKDEKETKVIPLFSWKKIAYTSAVAAGLILMFNFFFNTTDNLSFDTLETVSIEDYILGEDVNFFEIASLLTDDELANLDFTQNSLSDQELENYILDHLDIEELIIE